jgi:hypothetical protein
MEHNSFYEADNHFAGQEIYSFVWKPNVHYDVQNSLPLGHVLT